MDTVPKIIIGLGNNGDKYLPTRHNIGFWVIDFLANTQSVALKENIKLGGFIAELELFSHNIRIMKPSGFINGSGLKIKQISDFYKLESTDMLVIHDDIDLEVGKCKLTFGGSSGGHNGLKDIIAHHGKDFFRLKIGIGRPGFGDYDAITNYVLNKPSPEDQEKLIKSIELSVQMIELLFNKKNIELARTFLQTESKS